MPTPPEPRLMLLLDSLKVGGTEKQFLLLTEALSRRGWRVRLVTLTPETPLLSSSPPPSGGVDTLRSSGASNLLSSLADLTRSFQPDIIQSASLRPHALCLALKALGHRFHWVAAIRESLPLFHFRTASFMLTDFLVFRARLGGASFLSNSHWALKRKGVEGTVLANLLDPRFCPATGTARSAARKRLGLPEDAFIVGSVCNTTPYKGLEGLVAAAGILAASEPRLLLALAGEERGDYGRGVLREARSVLGSKFRHLGLRDDMPDVMPAFDAFCSASSTESSSNAVAEAMASGLPCVVTDAGDSAELVGDTGWVVPQASPESLARALGHALRETPERLAERGARSRERIERLRDWASGVAAHDRFFRTLLEDTSAIRCR